MSKLPRKSSLGSRAMGAALVTLGCSLGVSVPLQAAKEKPVAAAGEATVAPVVKGPLTAEQIKLYAAQYKLSADHIKLIEADNAQLAADQKALAQYQASLSADQVKLRATQEKLQAIYMKIEADQQRLSGHFIKIDAADLEAKPKATTK